MAKNKEPSAILAEPTCLNVGQTEHVSVDSRKASLDELLKPVRLAFAASGMTDDELAELLEYEKHAMRNSQSQ